MHDGHSEFDLSFSGRIDDSKFYDFNHHHLDDEIGTTTGFASAHRSDHNAAQLSDTARFVTHSSDTCETPIRVS
jgi:hypothetical protein